VTPARQPARRRRYETGAFALNPRIANAAKTTTAMIIASHKSAL
jgi:hypothetical protein